MLMASGANFGFRRSLPHMLGVGLGFSFMLLVVGTGLMGLFNTFPASYIALKVISVIYLLFLAWKIANAAPMHETAASATPFTFMQASLFQWVNPKAWVMALTAISVYSPEQTMAQVLMVALVFGAANLPAVISWTMLGEQMRRWLTSPQRLRAFNISMALLLVASLYPVLIPA
jgi:threonine/homoserine/homoserine lactone efflux protein